MAESDPRDYRGGVHESGDEKGNEGVVPREMVDEDTSGQTDEQEMNPEALGGLATETATEQVPRDGGDDADATHQGGQDDTPGSWAGEKANPDHGRTGKTEGH